MWETLMLTQQIAGSRRLETPEEFAEARIEATRFIFPGTPTDSNGKRPSSRSQSNLLHFARCVKLEKVGDGESKFWYRSIRLAQKDLDEVVGRRHWKWCKACEREITQRIIDEA
jgi:hypothetical protein